MLAAAAAGDACQATAILSVLSGIDLPTIDRAISLRSPKVLVSLVARAGLSMRAGIAIQGLLGRFNPEATLREMPDGSFPLSTDEMAWQIELLG